MSTADINDLFEQARQLADDLSAPVDGRDGKDGKDGRDGKDADPELIRALVDRAVADMPRPRDGVDGRDGKDADPELVRAEVQRAVASLRIRSGAPGPQGETGPMPRHEWDGTKLRFEEAPGEWGEWVDLRGPRGQHGQGGGFAPAPAPAAPVFSYFPSGW